MSIWSLLALGTAGLTLAVAPEEGTVWTINAGESETIAADSTVTTLTGLQDNGTVTIAKDLTLDAGAAAVYAVGNGAGANGSLTIAASKTLTVHLREGGNTAFKKWLVSVNGREYVGIRVRLTEDDHLKLCSSGTMLYIR